LNSIDELKKEDYSEFCISTNFQGISLLAALDMKQINGLSTRGQPRISRYSLIKKTQDLNIIYCFEIQNKEKDVSELIHKIFDESLFRFKFTNPDLYEQAKSFGKELAK
jgi:hypothetical protein